MSIYVLDRADLFETTYLKLRNVYKSLVSERQPARERRRKQTCFCLWGHMEGTAAETYWCKDPYLLFETSEVYAGSLHRLGRRPHRR